VGNWERYLSVLNEIELEVDIPKNTFVKLLQDIKLWGKNNLNPNLLRIIEPVTTSIFSAAAPSTRVMIKNTPENAVINTSGEEISILTANLWHDWPRHRDLRKRLECFVNLVQEEEIDIILLQELARTQKFAADEWLSKELGMAYVFSRANGSSGSIGFEEGLAVFSRYPISKPRVAQLSDQSNPFVRRIALGTTIETPLGNFLVFNVHLGLNGRQNEAQLSRLMKWVESESRNGAAVIGGDFNAREHTRQIKVAQTSWQDSYRDINPGGDGFTHQVKWPWGRNIIQSRLDYLFLKTGVNPWTILEANHIEVGDCMVSDHKPVLIRTLINN
jgi:endonuclease/exonuclease/phosphatase family metal-dependent hydrolase